MAKGENIPIALRPAGEDMDIICSGESSMEIAGGFSGTALLLEVITVVSGHGGSIPGPLRGTASRRYTR